MRSLINLAGQFTMAIAKWVAKGCPTVDEMEYARRRTICAICNGDKGWCPSCGCNIVLKAALATSRCPKDKW